ncbi:MAG: hypothetical protein ACF8OB_01420 [Phycisphaeraceae bacterium JB051]
MAEPAPDLKDKPEIGEQTGAQSGAVGLTSFMQIPGLSPAPAGTYDTYRQMLSDPTIALARAVVMSPLIGNTWSIQSKDDTPEDRALFIEEMLDPMIRHIIRGMLRSLDYGWAGFEKVFEIREGKLVLKRLKPLLHDMTEINVDRNGKFQGFKQSAVELGLNKSLLFTYDREGDNHYGRPRLENARQPWSWWNQANEGAARYDNKIAGVMPVIHYPLGKSKDKTGTERDNYEIAQNVLNNIAAGKGIAVPNRKAMEDDSDGKEWSIELMEDKGGRQGSFNDRLRYLDSLKFRAMLRPERSALEGQFGTKAEAQTHGDLGLLDGEQIQVDLAETVNWHVVDQLLVLNFGEEARGSVWFEPNPLQDESKQLARDIVKAMAGTPDGREFLRIHLDLQQVFELTSLPMLPEPEAPEDDPDPEDSPANSILDELETTVNRG